MDEDLHDDFFGALDKAGALFDAEQVAAELAKAGLAVIRVEGK
jgi:hypothetical protein